MPKVVFFSLIPDEREKENPDAGLLDNTADEEKAEGEEMRPSATD